MARLTRLLSVQHEDQTFTRRTDRDYSHVVIVKNPYRGVWMKNPETWQAYTWCGRPDLAGKKEREALKAYQDVKVLPVPGGVRTEEDPMFLYECPNGCSGELIYSPRSPEEFPEHERTCDLCGETLTPAAREVV